MPTCVYSTVAGQPGAEQRPDIARAIAAIHAEKGAASRYFVQILFYDSDRTDISLEANLPWMD